MVEKRLAIYTSADGIAELCLNRPDRHNALVPELLDDILAAIETCRREAGRDGGPDAPIPPRVLVLTAKGKSFSTGGDVEGFYRTPRKQRQAYAASVVGSLNRIIVELLQLPVPTIAAVHGTVTGGSLGLALACDIAVGGPGTSFAPWYTAVGFSPDGGWTGLLPERIGRARALDIQLLNRLVDADEAHRIGLIQHLADDGDVRGLAFSLAAKTIRGRPGSIRHTLTLCRPDIEHVRRTLDREYDQFLRHIVSDEAQTGMARFLGIA